MGDEGLERSGKSSDNSQYRGGDSAPDDARERDPRLASIVAAWPTLPEAVRAELFDRAGLAAGVP